MYKATAVARSTHVLLTCLHNICRRCYPPDQPIEQVLRAVSVASSNPVAANSTFLLNEDIILMFFCFGHENFPQSITGIIRWF